MPDAPAWPNVIGPQGPIGPPGPEGPEGPPGPEGDPAPIAAHDADALAHPALRQDLTDHDADALAHPAVPKLATQNTFTAAQVIDNDTSPTTGLVLRRNNAANPTALRLESSQVGGRVGLHFRDEAGTDVARLVAHNADDPAGVASGFRIYRRRATPRLDGAMHDNTFLIQSDTDFGIAGFYGATFLVNTHDTDGNLWTDKSAVTIHRSPADSVNEATEFLRARTSGVGTNYMRRDLAAADTAGPLLRIANENASDDQVAIRLSQACGQPALDVENTGFGSAILVRSGFVDMTEIGAVDPAAPTANRARLFVRDNGAGKTQLGVIFDTGAAVILATQS